MRRAAALPARSQGPGGNPRGRHGQQRRGNGEPRRPADRCVVSRYLHQVGDLPRGQAEEPHNRECVLQRRRERQHQVMPPGQVRALMRQDRVKLAVSQAGQRLGGEHDSAAAGQAVHGRAIAVDDLHVRGGTRLGHDGQHIVVGGSAAPGHYGCRAVNPRHPAQDRHRDQAPGDPGHGTGGSRILHPQPRQAGPQHGGVGAELSTRDGQDQPGQGGADHGRHRARMRHPLRSASRRSRKTSPMSGRRPAGLIDLRLLTKDRGIFSAPR